MPHATLKLIPGVDTTKTPTLNEMAVSRSNLVRLVPDRSGMGLVQKLGGWTDFITGDLADTIRALKAWSDLEYNNYLAIGGEGTVGVKVYNSFDDSIVDVTPYYLIGDKQSSFVATGNQLPSIELHSPVNLATVASALTATYDNVAGTLTNSGAQAALVVDGVTVSAGNRILVKNQTAQLQNGVYTVTNVGDSSTNWVLTRAADFNTWAAGNIERGASFYVSEGTQNAGTYFYCANATTVTVGVTSIIFVQGSGFTTNPGTDSVTLYTTRVPSSASYVYFPTIVNIGNINILGPYDILTTGQGFVTFEVPSLLTSIAKVKSITSGSNRIVTITFNQTHSFYAGQNIYVSSVDDSTFNGSFTISSTPGDITPYTIKYTQTGVSTATESGGGFVNARVNFGGSPPNLATFEVGNSIIQVTLQNHGFSVGDTFKIERSTTVGGVTLYGLYTVNKVIPAPSGLGNFSNSFLISADRTATSIASAYENGGKIYSYYFVSLTPVSQGNNYFYNSGIYNEGIYSSGYVPNANNGSPIASTNWSFDNWGSILVCCPKNGAIYYWQPVGGTSKNLNYMPNAPVYNSGIFVAMPQRQIIAYGSSFNNIQDPLLVRWCDIEDFTTWIAQANNQAGSYRIPTGSKIVGATQASQQALIWTDLDLWSMTYIGQPYIYGFNKIGVNAGLISQKAFGTMGGVAYWMGQKQFFKFAGNGVEVIPCPVWDQVFQNLYEGTDEDENYYIDRICCATNSQFNEVTWYFPARYLFPLSPEDDANVGPSNSGNGEVNAYVKYNVALNQWDYGYQDPTDDRTLVARTAWIDQSVLGPPIGAATTKSVNVNNDVPIDGYFTGASIYAVGDSGVETIYFYQIGNQFAVGSNVIVSGFTDIIFNGVFTVTDSSSGNSSPVSITRASPAVVTWNDHNLAENDVVYFKTTQTMPTGLSANTPYFVKTVLSSNTFTVSATAGGAAINTSSSYLGVIKCYQSSYVSFSNPNFTSPVTDTSAGIVEYQISAPVYQHETSNDAAGYGMSSGFTTGYASISDGDMLTFIDQVWPDMKWGQLEQNKDTEVNVTFYVTNYPGQTPIQHGPYPVNHETDYLSVRMRGRLIAISVSSEGVGGFWRMGGIRYRFQADGKY